MALYYCNCCDYLRCVCSIDECSANVTRKTEVHKKMRDATVCVKPESPFYGEHRRKNATACNSHADYYYKMDFDGDSRKARMEQARLVEKYRREKLGLETSLTENDGAGFAPCWN